MPVVKNTSGYSLKNGPNIRLHPPLTHHFVRNVHAVHDENVDSDREFLKQQQKACQARARQYSMETNQRRMALENRRKQWDIQEQKLRTEILQQRKQRLWEITERFQRLHIPSERTKAVSSARVPTLDEAFRQIQVDQSAYTHQSSFPACTSNIRRTCNSSPKPPEGSRGPRSPCAVSAAEAHTNLIQERGLGDFKRNQPPVNQLQENLVKDQEKLEQLQTQDHQDTQFSYEESLTSLDSLENVVSKHGPGSKPDSLGSPEVHDTRRLSLRQRQLNCSSPPSNYCPPMRFQEKVTSQQGLSIPSSSLPPSPVDESAVQDQNVQNFLKAAEQCKIDGQSQVSNIQSTLPCQKQLLAASSGHKAHQYVTMTPEDKLCDKVSPRLENSAPHTLEAGRNVMSHTEKFKRAEYQNSVNDNNNDRVTNSTSLWFAKLKNETEKTSAGTSTSHIGLKSKKVRFLKGILKKTPKCIEDGNARFNHSPAFRKQVALAIRDSLELSRSVRDKDNKKCTKKKVHWIDALPINGEENETIVTNEVMNKLKDTPKNNTTSPSSAGHNVTKHAWSDSGLQKGKHPEHTKESKVEKAAVHASGLCVPRRAHSAKAGTILFHGRRDTKIRPQSSSQIPRVSSTQGMVLVPHPPPRLDITIKTGNNDSPGRPDGQGGFQKDILNCTPTDEEISLLWNDVQSALASKEGESQSRANLSHVTIKGDSLSNGVRAVARMDNLLPRSPVQRPTLDTNMKNKYARSGYRNPHVIYQVRVPKTESKTNQMIHGLELQPSQRGLSDLSLEEQKLLQSLEKLNHRLQYVQDVNAGNPTMNGIAFRPWLCETSLPSLASVHVPPCTGTMADQLTEAPAPTDATDSSSQNTFLFQISL